MFCTPESSSNGILERIHQGSITRIFDSRNGPIIGEMSRLKSAKVSYEWFSTGEAYRSAAFELSLTPTSYWCASVAPISVGKALSCLRGESFMTTEGREPQQLSYVNSGERLIRGLTRSRASNPYVVLGD